MKLKFLQISIMALCGALILGDAKANAKEKSHDDMKPKVGMDCGQGCDCYTNPGACTDERCCSVGR